MRAMANERNVKICSYTILVIYWAKWNQHVHKVASKVRIVLSCRTALKRFIVRFSLGRFVERLYFLPSPVLQVQFAFNVIPFRSFNVNLTRRLLYFTTKTTEHILLIYLPTYTTNIKSTFALMSLFPKHVIHITSQ